MGRFEKVKPIIVKAAACLGIVGTAMLIVSPYSSQDAPQAAFESESRIRPGRRYARLSIRDYGRRTRGD